MSSAEDHVRRLAAIIFTDVVGYSARMQVDETGTITLVRADFGQMRQLCAEHRGQVLKSTGDGLLMCFDSVVDAVTCALAIQTRFAGRGEGALTHRIGVHLGDIFHQDGDIVGDGVNLAARLQTAGKPGAVCVSDLVFSAVKGKVPMESVALPPLKLKNIAEPMAAHLLTPAGTRSAPPAPAPKRNDRLRPALLVGGLVLLAGAAGVFFLLRGRASAPSDTVAAKPLAEFPHEPSLKRAEALIYGLDSIATDFALADDLVKPLRAARPNDPEVVVVAAEVAVEYLARGFDTNQARRADAQQLAERAVQLVPDNPAAQAALGTYLRCSRTQLGRAEETLRDAIKLDPKNPRYQRQLYTLLSVANSPKTDAFGASLVNAFPSDPLVRYEIAVHHMHAGDLAAAEAGFDETLKLAPLADAMIAKAKFMLEVHGSVQGMTDWLGRVPERQRTNARLANAYAVEALVTGKVKTAQGVVESITDTWLADGTYIFPKAMLVGDLESIAGHEDLARKSYEAALEELHRMQAADLTDIRPIRGELWVQLALKNREEARAALRLNLQKAPHPYRWHFIMTWWSSSLRACLLLGEREAALTQLKEACAEPQGRLILRNLFHVDPAMAPFRDEPAIVALLAEPAAKE